MKILESESEIRKIGLLIGQPIRKGVVGSTTYYVKRLHCDGEPSYMLEDYKAIIELYSDGLLMRTFKSNNRKFVPLPYSMIIRIRLRKGEEQISPRMLSPFWMLFRLGEKVEIARYSKFIYRNIALKKRY